MVAAMLWFEVIFILINGVILWLLFCQPGPRELSAAERFAQSEESLGRQVRRSS
jgi:hypothetical protein